MTRRLLLLLPALFITFLLVPCASCTGTASNQTPETIFLITLDTTRADYFDYNLKDNNLTPHFAALANTGFYFDNAYALIPITLPSHASMFYSLPPHQLKIYNNGSTKRVPRPTMTQLLKKKGFHTGAVISLGVLKSDFGLNKGFDDYVENFKPYLWDRTADEVNNDLFALIKKQKNNGKKNFYWVHYSDPHEPYFPPNDDGFFTLTQGNKKVFTCKSTEYAAVKTKIRLEPGENHIQMEAGIPSSIKIRKDCTISYYKFRELKVTATGKDAGKDNKTIQLKPPAHWTNKKEANHTTYYSSEAKSQLTVINTSDAPMEAVISFFYGMYTDKATQKTFYKDEITYMDNRFGKLVSLLKAEGIYHKAAFVVMGDHGEGLGEYRGHYGHIHYLNKIYSRVPLIVAGAGVAKQGKRTETVSNLNIAPTILELAGIKKPEFMLGQSLLEPVQQKRLLLETYSPEAYFDAFSLVDYPWQVIFYPGKQEEKLEFYNVRDDISGCTHIDGTAPLTGADGQTTTVTADQKKKTELVNSILKISRIITATKGKVGRAKGRHAEILKSLGYL